MATLTGTACAIGVQPRNVVPGSWVVNFAYNATTTLSAGDTILLGKIPHGATVVNGYLIQEVGDTGSVSLGIDASETNLIASQSTSAGALIRLDHGIPYKVSVSDDAVIRYHLVKIGVDSDFTGSATFRVILECTSDL